MAGSWGNGLKTPVNDLLHKNFKFRPLFEYHNFQNQINTWETTVPALKIPAYGKEEAGECKIRLCRPPFSSLLQFGLAAIIGMVQSRDIISFNCIVGKMVASTDNITIKGLQGIIAFDTGFYQP